MMSFDYGGLHEVAQRCSSDAIVSKQIFLKPETLNINDSHLTRTHTSPHTAREKGRGGRLPRKMNQPKLRATLIRCF